MELSGTESRIADESHLLQVREILRERGREAGLGIVDQTKLITAGSELARNILKYAGDGGGRMIVEVIHETQRRGLKAVFEDQGPGIADVDMAMRDGFSTGGSLGLGLPGSSRLVDEMTIDTGPSKGTRITITKWGR